MRLRSRQLLSRLMPVAMLSVSVAIIPETAAAAPAPSTYTRPGDYTYVVPAGVTALTVTVSGAQGGRGGTVRGQVARADGGGGAEITATAAVRPGVSMVVTVGGRGGDGDLQAAGAAGSPDGGAGGKGGASGGGGGGGSSSVSFCAEAGCSPSRTGLDRVGSWTVKAGGGGGGGGTSVDPQLLKSTLLPGGNGGAAGGWGAGAAGAGTCAMTKVAVPYNRGAGTYPAIAPANRGGFGIDYGDHVGGGGAGGAGSANGAPAGTGGGGAGAQLVSRPPYDATGAPPGGVKPDLLSASGGPGCGDQASAAKGVTGGGDGSFGLGGSGGGGGGGWAPGGGGSGGGGPTAAGGGGGGGSSYAPAVGARGTAICGGCHSGDGSVTITPFDGPASPGATRMTMWVIADPTPEIYSPYLNTQNVSVTAVLRDDADLGATGTIRFFVNGTLYDTEEVRAGRNVAQCVTQAVWKMCNALPVGWDTITAVYSGDATHPPGSASILHEVDPAPTALTTTVAPGTVVEGTPAPSSPVTFTATLKGTRTPLLNQSDMSPVLFVSRGSGCDPGFCGNDTVHPGDDGVYARVVPTFNAGSQAWVATWTAPNGFLDDIRAIWPGLHQNFAGSEAPWAEPNYVMSLTQVTCSPTIVFDRRSSTCTATEYESRDRAYFRPDPTFPPGTPPDGTISWSSSGSGNFSASTCTLKTIDPDPQPSASACSVTYTPGPQTGGVSIAAKFNPAADSRLQATSGNTTYSITTGQPAPTYLIAQADTAGFAVDVYGAGTANGTPIVTYPVNNNANQHWKFIPSTNDFGWYHLVDSNSGKCMDVTGASTARGTNIELYSCDPSFPDQPNQLWRLSLVPRGAGSTGRGGWVLVSKNSGQVLTRTTSAAGSHFIQWPQSPDIPGQLFDFMTPPTAR
ncbi:MAG: hypothetical protein JWP76_6072 [Dactylosporangium sp.]|nr:hypothetical protein [Dactylosporangium sp.]